LVRHWHAGPFQIPWDVEPGLHDVSARCGGTTDQKCAVPVYWTQLLQSSCDGGHVNTELAGDENSSLTQIALLLFGPRTLQTRLWQQH
jgi:hypothetical protein